MLFGITVFIIDESKLFTLLHRKELCAIVVVESGSFTLSLFYILAGFYETRVAYYSWRGAPGYTFASIPDY
jgi:hypothetical protein